MDLSTTEVATLIQGLPYLALIIFSVRQFFRHPDSARLYSVLAFVAVGSGLLLAEAGSQVLASAMPTPLGMLLLRLSTISILASVYVLFLLASGLLRLYGWLEWGVTLLFLSASLITLLAPGTLIFVPRPDVTLQSPVFAGLLLVVLTGCSLAAASLFWYKSVSMSDGARYRLQVIGMGVLLIYLSILPSISTSFFWGYTTWLLWLMRLLVLLAGAAFYVGFVSPRWLRRLWLLSELEHIGQLSSDLLAQSSQHGPFASEQGREEPLDDLLQRALQLFNAQAGVVALWNQERGELEPTASSALASPSPLLTESMKAAGLAEAFTQRQMLIQSIPSSQRFRLWRQARSKTLLAVPLLVEGNALGVLGLSCEQRPLFLEDHPILLQHFADHIAQWLVSQQQSAALAMLRQKQRRKDEFIAFMAHELRSPLTVLKGRVQLLQRQFPKADQTQAGESLAQLERQCARLNEIISTLVDVSYLDAGWLELVRHPTDLTGLLRETIEQERRLYPAHALLLESSPPASQATTESSGAPVIVLADSKRLHQVITALVKNACQRAPAGSNIDVWLERHAGADEAVVLVRDVGPGISQEEQVELFLRWPRGLQETIRERGELDLSLYISSEVIKLHGGRLWVENRRNGEGATFAFALPLMSLPEVAHVSSLA